MKRKYGNKTVTVDSLTFDSELESRYYLHLKGLRDAGIVERFEMQQQFELLAGYTIAGKKRQPVRFTPDFVVYYADGHIEVVDIKGSKMVVSRDFPLRKKLFETKFNMPLYVIGFSQIDGGWIELDDLDKARAKRKREKAKGEVVK